MTQPANAPDRIRVMVVHPNASIRRALCAMIADDPRFQVVSESPGLDGLTRIAAQAHAAAALIDGSITENDSGSFVAPVSEYAERLRIAVATDGEGEEAALRWLRAGVTGVLSWNDDPAVILSQLALVAKGDVVFSRSVLKNPQRLLPAIRTADGQDMARIDALSERELEILRHVAGGRTNPEISQELDITENTVKAHVSSILEKLDVRNRQQATGFALQEGLVSEVEFVVREPSESSEPVGESGDRA